MKNSKTLIIYAHPQTPGHNPLILAEIIKQLKKEKKSFELIDLYKINYNPVLSKEEHYTSGEKILLVDTKKFQKQILESENLIFIYPIWWGSMPAILKGFIDRVLTSGFAFKYVNGLPQGLLKGKKAAVIITSGAPSIITKYFLGNRYQKSIKNDILGFCGVNAKVFQIDKASKLTDSQKLKIEKNVLKAIDWLY